MKMKHFAFSLKFSKGVMAMFRVGSIFVPVTNLEKAKSWYEKNLEVAFIDA